MSSATSAPISLKFKSREIKLSPLDLNMIEELDNWVQAKFINTARAAFTPDMVESDRRMLLEIAFDKAASMSFMSSEGMKMFSSLQGIAMLMFVSCRLHTPDLTYQECQQLLLEPDALVVFDETFKTLNQLVGRGGRPANPPRKRQAKRKR